MRLDYVMYALAILFFVITATSLAIITDQTGRNLYAVSTVALGLLLATVGYYMRPQIKTASAYTPTVSTPQESAPATVPQAAVTIEAPAIEFTQIRGISKNRADQLKANGINNIQELANANPADLATKLNVSPKIVKMWIGSAKKQIK